MLTAAHTQHRRCAPSAALDADTHSMDVCLLAGRTWSTCKAEPWLHPPTKTPSSYLQGWPICYNVICCNVMRCIVGCCIVVLQRRTTLRVVRQAVAAVASKTRRHLSQYGMREAVVLPTRSFVSTQSAVLTVRWSNQ